MPAPKRILVTGASGFLGGRLAKHLKTVYPRAEVIGTSRSDFKAADLAAHGVEFIPGDPGEAQFADRILKGVDTVVHCAALSSPWGRRVDFERANVALTQMLITAAVDNGVHKFVYISTPSIYFNFQDRFNVSENDPLPARMVNDYADTKLTAERLVLAQNGPTFNAVALRPRAIIGAEDTVIFPRILKAYLSGRLKIIGSGKNVVDLTCVRNVIEGIVCAINAPESAMGRAYNISNDEPVLLWDEINYMLKALGYPLITKRVPYPIVAGVAWLSELAANLSAAREEPVLTLYGVGTLAKSLTMDLALAKKNLGYQPVQTTRQGIDEFMAWYGQRAPDN